MSEQSQQSRMQCRHIASLTHSEMVMLNLQELQVMGRFAYEVVLSDEEDRKIYAYEYEQSKDCYLLMVPSCFYTSTKNKCRMFVEMLLLCSQTISVPLEGDYCCQVEQLLSLFCLQSRQKKGRSILKIYLANQCWVTYLDFVTFQAIQFKGRSCKQLIAMKKSNSYQYCLGYFKENVLASIFSQGGDQQIQVVLQRGLNQVKVIYNQLCCGDRFDVVYEIMNETNHSCKDLEREIQALVLSRRTTTVADEEYQEIICGELGEIVTDQISRYEKQILTAQGFQQQALFIKILQQLLLKLKQYNFEINDQKYLFLSAKIIEKIYEITEQEITYLRKKNKQIQQTLQQKSKEIYQMHIELQRTKKEDAERELDTITEEAEEKEEVKLDSGNKCKEPACLTLKDVKEPLQVISSNIAAPVPKVVKVGFSKAKPKDNANKKREIQTKVSLKNLKIK